MDFDEDVSDNLRTLNMRHALLREARRGQVVEKEPMVDRNIRSIKMKIPSFQGKNDLDVT